MRKILGIVFLCSFLFSGCEATGRRTNKTKTRAQTNQTVKGERLVLADPFILYDEGVYYAYGTSNDDGLEVFTSDSLKVWKKHHRLALDKEDSYGDKWFWAPEVYKNPYNGRYYIFYSAEEHLCVAVSDTPLGPFIQQEKKPMIDEKAIDSSLFIDRDGTPYLFFVRFTDGNVIWGAELTEDWMGIKPSTLKQCIAAEMPWELIMGKVAEGPSVILKEGLYYMIYSANHYESQDYGVGYATSDSPLGDWVKSTNNPILRKPPGGLVGTGHGAVFKNKQGKDMYVFHAHWDSEDIQPRTLHMVPIEIAEGRVTIDSDNIINPVVYIDDQLPVIDNSSL